MTKKDYIKLAKLIKDSKESYHIPALMGGGKTDIFQATPFVNELCDILKSDNANFDKARFIQACQ